MGYMLANVDAKIETRHVVWVVWTTVGVVVVSVGVWSGVPIRVDINGRIHIRAVLMIPVSRMLPLARLLLRVRWLRRVRVLHTRMGWVTVSLLWCCVSSYGPHD